MEESFSGPSLDPYPVKLRGLCVRELWINTFIFPTINLPEHAQPLLIGSAPGKYEEENKTRRVTLLAKLGEEIDPDRVTDHIKAGGAPFALRVRLVGEFQFDESRFPMEKIDQWSEQNAPIILFPYMREQIFSLTARSGFRPLILPLVQVPTIKVLSEDQMDPIPPKLD